MTPRIGFHYPSDLASEAAIGSALRPRRMFDALVEIGCDVVDLTGQSSQRKLAMQTELDRLGSSNNAAAAGVPPLDAVYSESVTIPTVLADHDHRPRHPLADPAFFRALRQLGVPSGLFYRDVYWRFPEHKAALSPLRRYPTVAAYLADLWWYRRYVDVLFLPSIPMHEIIPERLRHPRPVALPPGAETPRTPRITTAGDSKPDNATPASTTADRNRVRVFYVGSTGAPYYDIDWLLGAVDAVPTVELRLCCPRADRDRLFADARLANPRIEVVHDTAEQLAAHYAWADVASLVFSPHPYRQFSMPIKLFEAIGAGVPIVATRPSSAADVVERDDLGFVVDGQAELIELFTVLSSDPQRRTSARHTVLATRDQHTWRRRAEQVVETLLGHPLTSG